MPRSSIPLAPIVKTVFAHRIIGGGRGVTPRRECWGAETADGVWEFEREESPGTPWLVYHKATNTLVDMGGTLRWCRWYVAAGHAQASFERIQAHEHGEHKAEPDPRCVKC